MNKILVCKLEVQSEEISRQYPNKVYINYVIDLYTKKLIPNIFPNEKNCWKICDGIFYSIETYDTDVIMMDHQTDKLIMDNLTKNLNRQIVPNKTYTTNCPLCNTYMDFSMMTPSMIISKELYGVEQNNNYVTICNNCNNINQNKMSELFRFKLMNKSIKPYLPSGFYFYLLKN